MIAYSFHAAGNGADGQADEGRWELAHHSPASVYAPARLAYRAHAAYGGEQLLLNHLCARLGSAFSRSLLTSYYISLKTNPFVVFTGREGAGKAALAEGFAAALLGVDSGQFVTISSASWAQRSGEPGSFRGMHERFSSLHFLETLQEAAAPEHAGKVYLVLLKGLTLDELRYYFQDLLQVTATGEKRLALPGVPEAERPLLPPNIFITATLHTPRPPARPDQQVLRHAGQIEFGPEMHAPAALTQASPPPVGLQRIMLAAGRHPECARERLEAILGQNELRRLAPSPTLAATLWRAGIPLLRSIRDDILAYVANSFDERGRGLFDPANAVRNAQLAFDAQVIQRVLWRLGSRRSRLRRRIVKLAAE